MPLITARASTDITKEKEISLKEQFGKAIELIGKSENWLMIEFRDNCHLYFKGNDAPSAIVEIELLGKASDSAYDKLTQKLTEIVEKELDIPKDRIYVKYSEFEHWGYSGFNF